MFLLEINIFANFAGRVKLRSASCVTVAASND